jgi:hypothetical protein
MKVKFTTSKKIYRMLFMDKILISIRNKVEVHKIE